ncbi:ABC transporter, permease protein 2 (cluster 5, nickel/peptides/opines) [hydrothermal vent metagenome]|uniref:ABC transporter, permease protein 2 (Cluster 5, nickel/peptides/opines) n=1 Tax=hydrothermal vent metagenome TaxID=652676 RepID=A0A3B0RM30_9ZZZZ
MTDTSAHKAASWQDWLTSDQPDSRRQARAVQFYLGWLSFKSNKLAMVGLLILLGLIFVWLFAPFLATHDPLMQNLQDRLLPPSLEHFFGTDALGRDIYSRVVHGAGITLYIVTLVAVTAPVFGLLVGTVAGYFGGWIDAVLMRITDIFLAFPKLILALAFVAALGAGLENAILALILTAWPPYTRIARAETLTIRKSEFIDAVRMQGAGAMQIIVRHIWPLCISSIIVRVTLDMAGVLLTAAGLGFLGLGAQPPTPEWGAMISFGRKFILDHWWVAAMPGLAIFVVSLGFNLLGDGLRDLLDPKGDKS